MSKKELSNLAKVRNVLRVAIYVRVSTQEQASEGYSIGEQIDRLTKYCEAMGWEVHKIYTDPGYSGGDTNRPGLKTLIRDVEDHKVDKVVVYKLDRLSRSQLDTLYLIEKVFLAHDTDFVSMSENFDTSTAFGRAMIGILAVFAQLEREQIKERMGMGKEARAKQGKWNGGPEPIGYNYNRAKDLLEVNEYEIMQYKELIDLFLQRTPLRTIETMFLEKGYAHKHGKWNSKSMKRVLKSKLYLGYMNYHNEWYKAEHDAVIEQETYDKVQKILQERADNYKATGIKAGHVTTYLGGLLFCKHCGGRYAKQENGRRKEGKPLVYWYMCHSRCKKVKSMIKDPNCKNKNWKMTELNEKVFNEIKKFAVDPSYIRDIKKTKIKQATEPNKIEIIEKEIEKIDAQISRFMDLYGLGQFTIEQVTNKVQPLNETRASLQRELESLNAESGRLSEEEAIEIINSFGEVLESGDFNAIRTLIELLIYYIEIDNDKILIHWKFA